MLSLVKSGYGSIIELRNLDTPDFLDMVEFEHISRAIDKHLIDREK
jgi:hypothetical protein